MPGGDCYHGAANAVQKMVLVCGFIPECFRVFDLSECLPDWIANDGRCVWNWFGGGNLSGNSVFIPVAAPGSGKEKRDVCEAFGTGGKYLRKIEKRASGFLGKGEMR